VLAVFQRDIKLADIASLAGLLVAQDRITLKRLLLERRQVTRLNMLRPEQRSGILAGGQKRSNETRSRSGNEAAAAPRGDARQCARMRVELLLRARACKSLRGEVACQGDAAIGVD